MARVETFRYKQTQYKTSGYEDKPMFGFRIVADNGEKIAGSEGYVSKANAERGARVLIETIIEIHDSSDLFDITHVEN